LQKSAARSLGIWVYSERVLRPPTWRISPSFRSRFLFYLGVLFGSLGFYRYHYRPSFAEFFFCIYIMLQNLLLGAYFQSQQLTSSFLLFHWKVDLLRPQRSSSLIVLSRNYIAQIK
jgi:uncharacterized membrane protein